MNTSISVHSTKIKLNFSPDEALRAVVTSSSRYVRDLNGKTFDIVEIDTNGMFFTIVLNDEYKSRVPLIVKAIVIVDFDKHYQHAYDNANWYGGITYSSYYEALKKYADAKGIHFTPRYKQAK